MDALECLDFERNLGIDQSLHILDSGNDSPGESLLNKSYIVAQTLEHPDCANATKPSLKDA